MTRILVLNDTRDRPNWGSQACAQALVDIITAAIPDVQIDTMTAGWLFGEYRLPPPWLGNRPFVQQDVGAWYLPLTHPLTYQPPRVADEFETLASNWLAGLGGPAVNDFLRRAYEADAVVFNAEGSTYRTNYMARLCLFMLWLVRTKLNVSALFLNGTVTLTNVDPVLPAIVRRTFSVLDGIAVREPVSLRNIRQFVPGAEACMIPDSVFNFEPDALGAPSERYAAFQKHLQGRPYFCVSASMLPMDFYLAPERSAIVHLVRSLKTLVPYAVMTAKDEGDQWLSDVAKATDSLFFGPEFSYADLMNLFNDSSFLVSGRYHNIIMASVMGCPAIPLTTTSPKIDGLCEVLEGQIGKPYDVTDLWSQIGNVGRAAESYLAAGSAKRASLRGLTHRLRESTRQMGVMIREAVARHNALARHPQPELVD